MQTLMAVMLLGLSSVLSVGCGVGEYKQELVQSYDANIVGLRQSLDELQKFATENENLLQPGQPRNRELQTAIQQLGVKLKNAERYRMLIVDTTELASSH